MSDFFALVLQHKFIQHALLAGILSSIACGITGTFVVVKRISFISGGIAHAVMGGLGIAYFFSINPLIGAIVFAILAALLIGLVKLKFRENEDTVIGAMWAIGMAIGIIFAYLTPGYNADLLSFLFGNILMVSAESLSILAVLDAVIGLLVILFFRQLKYVCFDEEYAALRGIRVDFIYLLLLTMIALTIVILIQAVGLILVIALLTLPASIAHSFASNIGKMMGIAAVLSMFFTVIGLFLSFLLNLPSGASIILVAGICYLLAFAVRSIINRLKTRQALEITA